MVVVAVVAVACVVGIPSYTTEYSRPDLVLRHSAMLLIAYRPSFSGEFWRRA